MSTCIFLILPNLAKHSYGWLIATQATSQNWKTQKQKQGVCHTSALLFTLKLSQGKNKSIMETQIFHHAKT